MLLTIFGDQQLEEFEKKNLEACKEQENEKQEELQTVLWEQELAELVAHKSCPLDLLHDHLGQELLWENQLRQNPLENEKNKKLDENKELDKKNFQSLIFMQLVALLLEKHFAFSSFFPASWLRSMGEVQRSFRRQLWQGRRQRTSTRRASKTRAWLQRPLASLLQGTLPNQLRREQLHRRDLCQHQLGTGQLYRQQLDTEQLDKNQLLREHLLKEQLLREQLWQEELCTKELWHKELRQKELWQAELWQEELWQEELRQEQLWQEQLGKQQLGREQLSPEQLSQQQLGRKQLESKQLRREQLGRE